MKPARLTITNRLVLGYGLHEDMSVFTPRMASREELEWFHAADYVEFLSTSVITGVARTCLAFADKYIVLRSVAPSTPLSAAFTRFNFADDCPVFDGMFEFCRSYAGASLAAARKLSTGTTDIAINWSGGLHHAKKSEASGFCYVNDIVLAIMELLR